MSNIPPNMPPGGAPPPYDPHTQWRIYREQQKAAWRQQREAWRAQRYQWKANYIGTYGPRVPSIVSPVLLIAIGIVALLLLTGHMDSSAFWSWYGSWWPALLIFAGLAMLAEWAIDARRKTPVRRGGSFVGIIAIVVLLGAFAAAHNHHWGQWNGPIGVFGGDNDFFNTFGLPEHDFDQNAISQQIPANASIQIEAPRGDVSITAGDDTAMNVQAHEVAFADSDSSAKNIFDSEAAKVTVSGSAVLIKCEGNSKGRVDLTIALPKNSHVVVNSGWGDVTATGLGAGMDVTSRGDIQISSVSGPVQVHFVNGRHDAFSAHDVEGNLTLDGDVNDLTLSEIKGNITQNGNIEGDVHIETISGAVHLHTPVTALDLAALPGDLTLDSDDLRITQAKGPVRVVTHSKDVDLSQIDGDSSVDNRNGSISIEPAGAFAVQATNQKGDIAITLPSDISATVNGRTHNGNISDDFSLNISGDEDKTVTGKIGSGTAHIELNTDNGDLSIKKGGTSASMAASSSSSKPSSPPTPPNAPNAPHLKSNKTLPTQPVAQ